MAVERKVKRNKGNSIITIGYAFNVFVNEKTAKGLVEATLKNYTNSLEYLKEFAGFDDDTDIKSITRELITQWIITMQGNETSPSAINHYLRDCRAFLYWCMDDTRKYLDDFKIETVRGQEPKQKTYTKAEIKALLAKPRAKDDDDYVAWRNWAIVNLIYDMGGRCSTITNIQMQDVNLIKRSIYLRHTKNKALSHMTISTQCAKVLKEFIEDWRSDAAADDYLFCSYANEQLTYNALAHAYTKYCKDRGVEHHSLHGLRHTYATELAENTNGDMVRVQKALGHSSIDMARKYVNLANVSMGDYDAISPLANTKDKRGRPKRGVNKKN